MNQLLVQLIIAWAVQELAAQTWNHVRQDRDAALSSKHVSAIVHIIVVSRPHLDTSISIRFDAVRAHALLHTAEVRVGGKLEHDRWMNVLAGSGRNVVDDSRAKLHACKNVSLDTLSVGLAVVRIDSKGGIHANREAVLGAADGFTSAVAACVTDDGTAIAKLVLGVSNEHDVLSPAEKVPLTCSATNDETFNTVGQLVLNMLVKGWQVNCTIILIRGLDCSHQSELLNLLCLGCWSLLHCLWCSIDCWRSSGLGGWDSWGWGTFEDIERIVKTILQLATASLVSQFLSKLNSACCKHPAVVSSVSDLDRLQVANNVDLVDALYIVGTDGVDLRCLQGSGEELGGTRWRVNLLCVVNICNGCCEGWVSAKGLKRWQQHPHASREVWAQVHWCSFSVLVDVIHWQVSSGTNEKNWKLSILICLLTASNQSPDQRGKTSRQGCVHNNVDVMWRDWVWRSVCKRFSIWDVANLGAQTSSGTMNVHQS